MSVPSLEQLLLLVNSSERRRLTGPEARALRDGIRALDNARGHDSPPAATAGPPERR